MQKIKNGIWILCLLLFPVNVYALTGGLTVACSPAQVRANGTVTCTITGTADQVVNAVEAQVSILNDQVTIVAFTKDSAWSTGTIDDTRYFNVSTENSTIRDSFIVGTLTLKISEDATATNDVRVNIQNVSFTDADGNKVSEGLTGGYANFSIEGQSEPHDEPDPSEETPKGLKSLTVSRGGELLALLDDRSGVIKLNSDASSFAISAVPESTDDAITCMNEDLSSELTCNNIAFVGTPYMNFKIVVGAGSRQVIYNLNVIKDVSAIPELATLTVGGVNVALEAGKYDGYVVELENVDSYQVSFTLADPDNFYVTNVTNPTIKTGTGEFGITVAAKDESSGIESKTYSISVVKAGGEPTKPPTQAPTNPQTGGSAAMVMAILLIVSFGASIFLYQKNINGYN